MAPNTLIEQNCGGEQKKPQKSQFSKYTIPVPFHFPLIPTWSATSYLEKSDHTIKIIYLVSLFTMRICCSSKKIWTTLMTTFKKLHHRRNCIQKSLQVSLWTNVWTRFAWSFIVGCSSLLANFCDLQNLLLKTQKIALRNPLSFYRPPSMNELSAYLSLELLQQLWCCWIRSFSTFPWIPLSWMQWKTQSLMKTNVNLTWSNAGQLNAQMTPGDNSKYVSATRSR